MWRKRNKYGAIKTVIDNITFDSIAESKRYLELRLLLNTFKISLLEMQPKFDIRVKDRHIAYYYADFLYINKEGRVIVEDVKSKATRTNPTYRLKKKFVEAIYNIKITEVLM